MSRDNSSVCDIVPRDYEAMYSYRCGLYEQCFRLSQESVDLLLYSESNRFLRVLSVNRSDLLLLMDDHCLSLISLVRLFGVFDIDPLEDESVNQLTLLMYLSVQSKLRFRHFMTSLVDILRVIQRVHDRHHESNIINRAMMTYVNPKTVLCLKRCQRYGR